MLMNIKHRSHRNIQNIRNIQNMNFGILIYICFCWDFRVTKSPNKNIYGILCFFWKIFLYFSVFCIFFIFTAFIEFVVVFCIYEDILKMFSHFLKNVQKCEQFSYELFFESFGDLGYFWGPKWSPPSPSPASMSKFPSRGKYERNVSVDFYDFFKETRKNWY